jgi:hypothetical protein
VVVDDRGAGAGGPTGFAGTELAGNRIEGGGASGREAEREAFVGNVGKGSVEKEDRRAKAAASGTGARSGRRATKAKRGATKTERIAAGCGRRKR